MVNVKKEGVSVDPNQLRRMATTKSAGRWMRAKFETEVLKECKCAGGKQEGMWW